MNQRQGKVYIIGAGPGDPDLLTVKGRRIIEAADVVLYADSLVHPGVRALARTGAEVQGTSGLVLEEIVTLMINAAMAGKTVARIASGDPSIYGAVLEQMRRLEAASVEYEIIPGVSSAFAAAAVLKTEFTIPEVSQTVIFSRMGSRTTVPAAEEIRGLASHGCTLVLFLSILKTTDVVTELVAGGYAPETPVAVVYRVTWPEELVIRGTLADIAAKVRKARLTLHALILVGAAFAPRDAVPRAAISGGVAASGGGAMQTLSGTRSRLYSREFPHTFRKAPKKQRSGKKAPAEPKDQLA